MLLSFNILVAEPFHTGTDPSIRLMPRPKAMTLPDLNKDAVSVSFEIRKEKESHSESLAS